MNIYERTFFTKPALYRLKGKLFEIIFKPITHFIRYWDNNQVYQRHLGNRIIDIGCGTGNIPALQNSVAEMVSLDLSMEMIRALEAKPNRHLLVGDARMLPIKDNSFDLATFNGVIHHLEEHDGYLAVLESLRVSRKVIINDCINADGGPLRWANSSWWRLADGGRKYRTLTEWHKLFKDCKANIIEEYYSKVRHFYLVVISST